MMYDVRDLKNEGSRGSLQTNQNDLWPGQAHRIITPGTVKVKLSLCLTK